MGLPSLPPSKRAVDESLAVGDGKTQQRGCVQATVWAAQTAANEAGWTAEMRGLRYRF